MKPVCHIVAGPNGAGKSTFALDYLPEFAGSIEYVNPVKMSKEDREVQEASDAATWKAIEAYRTTGDMVPAERNGRLVFLTVDEALRTRDDYDRRRRETGDWRLKNLLAQFAAEGQPLTPDVWDRLEQDRRQALADDLAWIARGRAFSRPSRSTSQKRSSK